MTDNDVAKIAEAATSVMTALQPLTPDERSRVIQSAAALFGVVLAPPQNLQQGQPTSGPFKGGGDASVATSRSPASTSGKPVSLVELLKEKQPATNAQRIACFAYYREKYEKIENFSGIDLASYFAKAKLSAPGPNYSRDYNKAVKEAWIHDDDSKSYLTQDGESAVEVGFGGKRKPPGPVPGKKKKKVGKSG